MISQMAEKRYLTMKDLQGYLSLSRCTIYSLIGKRKLPFIPLSKRAYRFDRLEIDRWMLKNQVKTAAHFLEGGQNGA